MKGFLTSFVLPVIIIIFAFTIHIALGWFTLALYAIYIIWAVRPRIYAYQGSVHYSKGDLDQALRYYEIANSSSSIKPNQRIGYGYLLLRKGELEKAEEVMTSVLKKNLNRDETIVAYSNYALLQWKKGDLDGAIRTLQETMEKYKNSNLYTSLGYFLIEKGDLAKALEFNKEAYEYNDSDPAIIDNYAYCLYESGELELAAELYAKAIEKNPRFPEVYYNYGLVLLALNRLDEAEMQLKKSLEMKPSLINAVTEDKVKERLHEIETNRKTD